MFPQKIIPVAPSPRRGAPAADVDQVMAEVQTLWQEGQTLVQEAQALLQGLEPTGDRATGRLWAALDALTFHGPRLLAPPSIKDLTAEEATSRRSGLGELVAQLRESLARDRQSVAAARSARAAALARRRALAEEVRAPIEGTLGATLAQAREHLAEAEAEAAEARARLEAHERTPPADRAATAEWARQMGTLRDELAAYELLVDQARAAATAAEGAYKQALAGAWDALEAQAKAEADQVERDCEAAIAAALAAVEAAREQLRVRRLAAMERATEVAQARAGV